MNLLLCAKCITINLFDGTVDAGADSLAAAHVIWGRPISSSGRDSAEMTMHEISSVV